MVTFAGVGDLVDDILVHDLLMAPRVRLSILEQYHVPKKASVNRYGDVVSEVQNRQRPLHFIAQDGRRDANRVIAEASNASLGWLHASKFTDSKTHAATPDNLLPPWHVSCCIHCSTSQDEDSENTY
jgi:hypothetical protein